MVPRLHARGHSFRGAAAYLLHDKDRARSSHRVGWTHTHNLATENPQVAWRVMAATAMDAGRLKQNAGVKNTGRKSVECVLHLTLSWHPSEKPGLTREEMLSAAAGAIKALRAEDRQALVVCHTDEPQPHVHVLVNRVSPEDGRMLTSSKEKLALSAWAQRYEQDRGQTLCQERVANNAARQRGEYTRAEPDTPRHVHEREAAQQNTPGMEQARAQERTKDAALARLHKEQRAKRREDWEALLHHHADARQLIDHNANAQRERAHADLLKTYQPRWDALRHQHETQTKAFAASERSLLGRARNAWQALDLRGLFQAETRRTAIQQAREALASKTGREEALRRQQEKDARELRARQRHEEQQQEAAIRGRRDAALAQERTRFLEERQSLILAHQREAVAQRQQWQTRRQEREQAFSQARAGQNVSMNEVDRLRERLRQQREQRMHQRRDHHRGMEW